MWCHRRWVCAIAQRVDLLFERNSLDKFGGSTTYLPGVGETSRLKTHSKPLSPRGFQKPDGRTFQDPGSIFPSLTSLWSGI